MAISELTATRPLAVEEIGQPLDAQDRKVRGGVPHAGAGRVMFSALTLSCATTRVTPDASWNKPYTVLLHAEAFLVA